MDKVFVISLHRTATRSTTTLLRALGYRALHWPFTGAGGGVDEAVAGREGDLDHVWSVVAPMVERFDAFSDIPFPVLYRHLHEAYPDARFVLMHRSPRAWLRSVRRHIGEREFSPLEKVQYWHYLKDRPTSLADIEVNRLLAMHWRHMADATEYFNENAPGRLATIGIDEPGAGERLQMFLGYPGLFPLPRIGGSEGGDRAGLYEARLRQSRASMERARFAVARAPGNPTFHRHLGRLLAGSGDAAAAAAEAARADELEAALRQRRPAGAAPAARRRVAPAEA